MNLVSKEAEIIEIEDELKTDPVIADRLMTFINSPTMGVPGRSSHFAKSLPTSATHR